MKDLTEVDSFDYAWKPMNYQCCAVLPFYTAQASCTIEWIRFDRPFPSLFPNFLTILYAPRINLHIPVSNSNVHSSFFILCIAEINVILSSVTLFFDILCLLFIFTYRRFTHMWVLELLLITEHLFRFLVRYCHISFSCGSIFCLLRWLFPQYR